MHTGQIVHNFFFGERFSRFNFPFFTHQKNVVFWKLKLNVIASLQTSSYGSRSTIRWINDEPPPSIAWAVQIEQNGILFIFMKPTIIRQCFDWFVGFTGNNKNLQWIISLTPSASPSPTLYLFSIFLSHTVHILSLTCNHSHFQVKCFPIFSL